MRRILLIANPKAAGGQAARRMPDLMAQLHQRQVRTEGVITNHPGHAVELAQMAAHSYDCLLAVGGDGTVNEVASGLLRAGDTRAVLGVVPVQVDGDVFGSTPAQFQVVPAALRVVSAR